MLAAHLIASANLLQRAVNVNALGNVGRLLLNGDQHVAGVVIKALLRAVIANLLDGAANDRLVVKDGLARDFAEHHDHAGLGGRLARDLGIRVRLEARIHDGVRHLVADLVCMTTP